MYVDYVYLRLNYDAQTEHDQLHVDEEFSVEKSEVVALQEPVDIECVNGSSMI